MARTWVVYRRPTADDPGGPVGVCTQAERVVMDRAVSGRLLTLVRAGIPNEPDAERLARDEGTRRPPGAVGRRPKADWR
jgi:hypothetical protein